MEFPIAQMLVLMTGSILRFLVPKSADEAFKEAPARSTANSPTVVETTTTQLNTQIVRTPDIFYEPSEIKYARKHLGRRQVPTVRISQYQRLKGSEPVKLYPSTKLTRDEKKEVISMAWNNGRPIMVP